MVHYRITVWTDDRKQPIQVCVAALIDWEPRAEACESVGPFESVEEALARAELAALNLMDQQIEGQLRAF